MKRTPLYHRHLALGAKVIDFGGWAMPVQYKGILEEHRAVREAAGLFDVSHMGEIRFRGPRAAEAVQRVTVNNVPALVDGAAHYTCTLREDGGIVDDCIVYRTAADDYLIVVNASNIAKDFDHFTRHAGTIAEITDCSDATGLLAVQGPRALAVVGALSGGALPAKPFTFVRATIAGAPVTIARTGYTGEDGVEIFVAAESAPTVWDAVMAAGAPHGLQPIGLGARDTLRLEARLCLYGNDIDEQHEPIGAGLAWIVKGRGFVGEEAVARVRAEGPAQRLVGFKVHGRGIARHGYAIFERGLEHGSPVGVVTSGTVAPTIGGAVGMGWVPPGLAEPGKRLVVDCRGKPADVEIVKGPFYKRGAP